METKPLLYGLIGFFIGGFIVSVAATTFDKPQGNDNEMTMSEMVASLKDKSGDSYDQAFINEMIAHHQSAVDMAKLSATKAKHDEVKELSNEIIKAQETEIDTMKRWQAEWGYVSEPVHGGGSH